MVKISEHYHSSMIKIYRFQKLDTADLFNKEIKIEMALYAEFWALQK